MSYVTDQKMLHGLIAADQRQRGNMSRISLITFVFCYSSRKARGSQATPLALPISQATAPN